MVGETLVHYEALELPGREDNATEFDSSRYGSAGHPQVARILQVSTPPLAGLEPTPPTSLDWLESD